MPPFFRKVTAHQDQQQIQSGEQLHKLRQAVASTATTQELEAALKKLFGRKAGLSPSELRTPMPELRQQLLARAEQAATAMMRSIEAQSSRKPDQLVKETSRIAISALAYATGFAFLTSVMPCDLALASKVSTPSVVDQANFEDLAE